MEPKIDLKKLIDAQHRPAPFEPGEALFWDDPYIATQMLASHLDTTSDGASRRPETIDREVRWLIATLKLAPGCAVLDLGCGPGLYTSRFASFGLRVTGLDYSRNSIAYAKQQAQQAGQAITYRYQDYLTLHDTESYDAICLINGDYCPLSPTSREKLLVNIQRALKPGGYFAFDVTTPTLRRVHGLQHNWYAVESGFWKPGPHLVLEQGFHYPEDDIYLDQYTIIEQDGTLSVYRNWFQDFTAETITREMENSGFKMIGLWSDLRGSPLREDAEWIGVIVRK